MKIYRLSNLEKPSWDKAKYPNENDFHLGEEWQTYLRERDKISQEKRRQEIVQEKEELEKLPEIGEIDPESGFTIVNMGQGGQEIPAYDLLEVFGIEKYAYGAWFPVKNFVPRQINYNEIIPTQHHVSLLWAQRYRTNPPNELARVVFWKQKNQIFAQDHTRIVAQILNGKEMVDVRFGIY